MKINDLSYNVTSAKYGYNDTHEQDLEVNADGNYLDFGNFGYDTRVAMRRNQEPLRINTPSKSNYIAFNCNPILFKDIDGNWAWIANMNIGKYPNLFKDVVEGNPYLESVIKVKYCNELVSYQYELNGFYEIWNNPKSKHYAPAVASFLKDNSIYVAISEMTKESKDVGGTTQPNYQKIRGYSFITMNLSHKKNFESVFIHELLHAKGYGEFAAYAGQLAANYNDKYTDFKSKLKRGDPVFDRKNFDAQEQSYRNAFYDMVTNAPKTFFEEQLKNGNLGYNNDGMVEIKNMDKYLNAVKKYGENVINGTTPVNEENDVNAKNSNY